MTGLKIRGRVGTVLITLGLGSARISFTVEGNLLPFDSQL